MGQSADPSSPPRRPRGLAGEYLLQALDALQDSGDPLALYGSLRNLPQEPEDEGRRRFAVERAKLRRLAAVRRAILFSALSAEAYVNEFLAVYLGGKDLDAVDKMTTPDKYVLGTRLAVSEELFRRNREPAQTIGKLFHHRNKLVHPKPGYGPPALGDPAWQTKEVYSPRDASGFVVAVAGAAVVLLRRAMPRQLDMPAEMLWLGRRALLSYGRRATKGLPDLTADSERRLYAQAVEVVTGGPGVPPDELL